MNKKKISDAAKYSVYLVGFIWLVYIVDVLLPYNFSQFGIYPRTIPGLKGVIFAPFIHANLIHILSNTISLFLLSFVLFSVYTKLAVRVLVLAILISGIGVWMLARQSYHVGASGLIYAIAAFLIAAGLYSKKFWPLIISIIIGFTYGGLIWGVFPSRPYISWEGHLFGAISGVFLAWAFRQRIIRMYK